MVSGYPIAPDNDKAVEPLLSSHVVIIGASIGAGHTSAARELERRLLYSGFRTSYHDILDALPPPFRVLLRDLYSPLVNSIPSVFAWLMSSWESDTSWMVHLLLWSVSKSSVLSWIHGADAVATTHAIATQVVGRLKDQGRHGVPIASYHCDAGMHPLLFHHAVSLNLVPIPAAVQTCRRYGHEATTIAPLVRPQFRERVSKAATSDLYRRLEKNSDCPIILLAAGSLGIGQVLESVRDILQELVTAQLVVLCGLNVRLQQSLQQYPRVLALGWREDVAEILAFSHIMVHNAGGMAVWEAMAAGLPVITYRPLPGHGQANAAALKDSGLSPWPRNRHSLGDEMRRTLTSGKGKVLIGDKDPALGEDLAVVHHIANMICSHKRPEYVL